MFDLPLNSTKIQYLTTNGEQYIDLPYIPTNTTGFRILAHTLPNLNGNTGNNNRLIGVHQGSNRFLFASSPQNSNNTFFGFGSAISIQQNLPDAEIDASLNYKNNRKAILNGTTYQDDLPTLPNITTNIQLFANKYNNNPLQPFRGRFYECWISEGETVVAHLIPIRINQSGFVFDEISGTIYKNQGTASPFHLGPDVREDIAPNALYPLGRPVIFPNVDRSQMIPVEYIQSSNYQIIDTGLYIDTSTDTIDIDAAMVENSPTNYFQCIYSASKWTSTSNFTNRIELGRQNANTFLWQCKQTPSQSDNSIAITAGNTKHNYRQQKNQLYIDGELKATSNYSFVTSGTLCLFNSYDFYNVPRYNYDQIRLYGCKIYKEDTIIMDLIPVRIGIMGALYDNVSKKLFTNSGASSLTAGPDL